jgi:hypothetical protein
MKQVLAVVGLGVTLTIATLPAPAIEHGQFGGSSTGHKVG